MVSAEAFGPDVPVFRYLGKTEDQRRWLATLPALVAEFERRWQLSTGPPFGSGSCSWVAPGETRDGRSVVLKIGWPDREALGESEALRFWDGNGAVLVHAADPIRFALLLERCEPGTALSDAGLAPEEALVAAAHVLNRLWTPAPPADLTLESLGDVTAEWVVLVRERMHHHGPPFDPGLVEHGAALLESLPRTATRTVVLHGDFNPGNLLVAHRQPWLAIDPRPMIGDPAYDPPPLLAQVDPPFATSDPVSVVRHRYRLVAELVQEPVERLLAWAVARTVESALWNVARGEMGYGQADMVKAAVLADVAGL